MVIDGNNKSSLEGSFINKKNNRENLDSFQSQASQRREAEKNLMEMEGRGYSELYRNTSEEMFIKSLMETTIGMPVPTMEMLGFNNLSQNFRADSEELFKSWLTNGENNGHNSPNIAHRTRQASRRISTDLSSLSNQQHGGSLPKKISKEILLQYTSVPDEPSNTLGQQSIRNNIDPGLQASNLYLAKAWFHSSQPMTRSRSSELRRRYAAMQSQPSLGLEAIYDLSGNGVNNLKQEFGNTNGFTDASMCEISNQFGLFMSPSNSSSSTFNTRQIGMADNVSSVVSMLKGTLERKKLNNQIENEAAEDGALECYGAQGVLGTSSLNQGQENHFHEANEIFQDVSAIHVKDNGVLQNVGGSMDTSLEDFMAPVNRIQMGTLSREPSQSESSAAAPVVINGFDACDGPSNSCQIQSNRESSRKQLGNGRISKNGSGAKDIRQRLYDNPNEDQKGGSLIRYGSVTSAASVDKGDPTKKRRVERSRKMAEAKERNLTPPIPSDMQSILKRCENLEKEVRSLKLNLAFMNRKDSEQTKQIEDLQKQNEELSDEKERLLEEIERILSETGTM